jgi:hypothetical protein
VGTLSYARSPTVVLFTFLDSRVWIMMTRVSTEWRRQTEMLKYLCPKNVVGIQRLEAPPVTLALEELGRVPMAGPLSAQEWEFARQCGALKLLTFS